MFEVGGSGGRDAGEAVFDEFYVSFELASAILSDFAKPNWINEPTFGEINESLTTGDSLHLFPMSKPDPHDIRLFIKAIRKLDRILVDLQCSDCILGELDERVLVFRGAGLELKAALCKDRGRVEDLLACLATCLVAV